MADRGGDTWYRVYEQRYAPPLNEFDEPEGRGHLVVHEQKWYVSSITKKGVWLSYMKGGGKSRWQSFTATKKFACPTREEAYESFFRRKQVHRNILMAQVAQIDEAVYIAQEQHARYSE